MLQIIAPCTQAQVVATLRAWLCAYNDEDLAAQVEPVVAEALAKLPPVQDEGPPSTSPQRGQVN